MAFKKPDCDALGELSVPLLFPESTHSRRMARTGSVRRLIFAMRRQWQNKQVIFFWVLVRHRVKPD